MKKRIGFLFGSIAFFICLTVTALAAPLPNWTLLTITPGLVNGPYESGLASGSAFAMGDGIHGTPPEDGSAVDSWAALKSGTDGGIIVGSSQPIKAIVAAWSYYNTKGYNYTLSPVTADTNGDLDFSGLTVFWGGWLIPMGSTSDYSFTAVTASTYIIDGAHVISHPTDSNFMFNGVVYTLHLEGNIVLPTLVPEPTSMMLLGSGLAGLVGVVWRRKKR